MPDEAVLKADSEWPAVGDAVAIVEISRNARAVRFSTVNRIGKRDIVLDNGERFRVSNLERQDGDIWSIRTSRIMRPEDPKVTEIREAIRRANLLHAAQNACEDFRFTGSVRGSTVTAADVILALAPLTGVEDEIRALFDRSTRPGAQGGDQS